MKAMTLKTKIVAIVVGIVLAGLALVKADIWYTARQAEQADPPRLEEPRP